MRNAADPQTKFTEIYNYKFGYFGAKQCVNWGYLVEKITLCMDM